MYNEICGYHTISMYARQTHANALARVYAEHRKDSLLGELHISEYIVPLKSTELRRI